MNYTWLLFDADGTLFDYSKAEAYALANAIKDIGLPFKDEYLSKYITINRSIWDDFEKGLISAKDLRTRRFDILFALFNIESSSSKFSEIYLRHLSTSRFILANALKVIKELSQRYKLAIITNGLMEVQKKRFGSSEIIKYFDHIIISEEIGFTKPDPQYFNRAMDIIEFYEKKNILIIGDSLTSDIKGANNIGIDACWFNPEKKENLDHLDIKFEIRDLKKILTIL